MIELLLALLLSVGVISYDPPDHVYPAQGEQIDNPEAEPPAYAEVECFVSCMHWCLIPGPPSPS